MWILGALLITGLWYGLSKATSYYVYTFRLASVGTVLPQPGSYLGSSYLAAMAGRAGPMNYVQAQSLMTTPGAVPVGVLALVTTTTNPPKVITAVVNNGPQPGAVN